jgi:arginine-tRNA-protein transferase
MSNNPKSLQLFATDNHACSYINGQQAKTLFIDPSENVSPAIYSQLCERGFRRSGQFIYRPNCDNCQACISIRVPVSDYAFSRSEKRILKRNLDLSVHQVDSILADEFYQLYARYINLRHADGDMYPANREQYENFLNNGLSSSCYFVFYHLDTLVAVAVVDRLQQALSAVYTFYAPEEEKRSLGSFAVLWQIQMAQRLNLQHVYLGYWVKDCAKMSYKTRFKPTEILTNGQWQALNL